MITFVIFYIDLEMEVHHKIQELAHGYRVYQPQKLLSLLFASIRRVYPSAKIVLLTNESTLLPKGEQIEVIKSNVDPAKVVTSRLEATIDYLKKAPKESKYVVMDYDMIVQKPFDEVFEGGFDVGLTARQHKHPINGGIVFLPENKVDKGVQFHQGVLDIVLQSPPDRHLWWAQEAIIKYVGLSAFLGRVNDSVRTHGLNIHFFPDQIYNYTPPVYSKAAMVLLPEKAILHFKGKRKLLMQFYWDMLNS